MKNVFKGSVILSIVGVTFIIFGFMSSRVDPGFKGIHFSGMFQFLEPGRIHPDRQSLDVYYSKDYLIARGQLNVYSIGSSMTPGSSNVSEGKLTLDTSYIYYICKRGEKFGLAFDSVSFTTGKPTPVNVDSTVQAILGAPSFFYKLRSKGKDSVNIVRDESRGLLVEKYVYKRMEIQEPDSLYFYFRKQPLEISFNMKQPRKDNMHLYKARAICNASRKGTFPNANFDVAKFEYSFEITDTDVPMGEVSDLIQRFKRANQ
ncbi:hypothetical protein OQY15_17845 [Pedobacter sp. MC2016-15]|uniref:hypothetical protein n=1 Tax=Pedobacter sp. MC2016-15 TaxID=2994473 RepID=UPI002246DCD7|nr:hypothetical protein [Pedobacter sp. MC2016-15]MCX2480973.1 hypothetical protein [Pedobacter sp. MC2016-15]